MNKIYIVYWTQTGNTLAMAQAVGQGVTKAGKTAEIVDVSSADLSELEGGGRICSGLPGHGRGGSRGREDGAFCGSC